MKKILFLIAIIILSACTPSIGELKLSTLEMSVDKAGGNRMVAVTSNTTWTVTTSADSDWCVPARAMLR